MGGGAGGGEGQTRSGRVRGVRGVMRGVQASSGQRSSGTHLSVDALGFGAVGQLLLVDDFDGHLAPTQVVQALADLAESTLTCTAQAGARHTRWNQATGACADARPQQLVAAQLAAAGGRNATRKAAINIGRLTETSESSQLLDHLPITLPTSYPGRLTSLLAFSVLPLPSFAAAGADAGAPPALVAAGCCADAAVAGLPDAEADAVLGRTADTPPGVTAGAAAVAMASACCRCEGVGGFRGLLTLASPSALGRRSSTGDGDCCCGCCCCCCCCCCWC